MAAAPNFPIAVCGITAATGTFAAFFVVFYICRTFAPTPHQLKIPNLESGGAPPGKGGVWGAAAP